MDRSKEQKHGKLKAVKMVIMNVFLVQPQTPPPSPAPAVPQPSSSPAPHQLVTTHLKGTADASPLFACCLRSSVLLLSSCIFERLVSVAVDWFHRLERTRPLSLKISLIIRAHNSSILESTWQYNSDILIVQVSEDITEALPFEMDCYGWCTYDDVCRVDKVMI